MIEIIVIIYMLAILYIIIILQMICIDKIMFHVIMRRYYCYSKDWL